MVMNQDQLCYYAIAKFIPDLIKNEPKNIGVIFYNENENFYSTKFVTNLTNKLGSSILPSDREIINNYFSYFKELKPSNREEINTSIIENTGKFQFSEMKSVVTKDLDREIEYLYSTFIDEPKVVEKSIPRLKTSLKREFQHLKLLGKKKLEVDKELKGGKSNLQHIIDFSYQNAKLYAIEAVDLSINDKRKHAYETAFKFEDLYFGLGRRKTQLFSIIKKSKVQNKEETHLIKALEAFSTVYNFSNGQRERFLNDIGRIVK